MNNNDFIIRLETKDDYREVENMTREAFWNVYKPGADEHFFVHVMRDHKDFIPELAFVIEKDGRIIGNIMYTKSKLVDENGEEREIVSFGPLGILPEFQRMGYGKALIEHSFKKVIEMGYGAVVHFGNPGNYMARGYKSCKKYNVCLDIGESCIYPTALLVKELTEGFFDGRKWIFHESNAAEPCNDTAAVEAFDATFPPKEKLEMPSQEEFYIYSHSQVVF